MRKSNIGWTLLLAGALAVPSLSTAYAGKAKTKRRPTTARPRRRGCRRRSGEAEGAQQAARRDQEGEVPGGESRRRLAHQGYQGRRQEVVRTDAAREDLRFGRRRLQRTRLGDDAAGEVTPRPGRLASGGFRERRSFEPIFIAGPGAAEPFEAPDVDRIGEDEPGSSEPIAGGSEPFEGSELVARRSDRRRRLREAIRDQHRFGHETGGGFAVAIVAGAGGGRLAPPRTRHRDGGAGGGSARSGRRLPAAGHPPRLSRASAEPTSTAATRSVVGQPFLVEPNPNWSGEHARRRARRALAKDLLTQEIRTSCRWDSTGCSSTPSTPPATWNKSFPGASPVPAGAARPGAGDPRPAPEPAAGQANGTTALADVAPTPVRLRRSMGMFATYDFGRRAYRPTTVGTDSSWKKSQIDRALSIARRPVFTIDTPTSATRSGP